jgi:hypothetical protein
VADEAKVEVVEEVVVAEVEEDEVEVIVPVSDEVLEVVVVTVGVVAIFCFLLAANGELGIKGDMLLCLEGE